MPPEDNEVWWSESKVMNALMRSLDEIAALHGTNEAKAVCWDLRAEFMKQIRDVQD